MKLDEVDKEWTAEKEKAVTTNRDMAQRWLGNHMQDTSLPVVQRSLFCQRNSHARCIWAECKCVCHDSGTPEWCGSC